MIRNAFRASLACVAIAASAPLAAEVTDSSADHFVARDSVTVKAAPKAAWLMLIKPEEWWDDSHTWSGSSSNLSIVPQGGGCFCERIPEKDSRSDIGLAGSAQHMIVLMAEPMKVLRMRGALGPLQSEPVEGVLTFTLQADKASGGTKVVMEYVVGGHMRYDVPKISKAVDEVMSMQLGRFADKLGRIGEAAAKPGAQSATKPGAAPSDGDVGATLDAMDGKADD